MCLHSVYSRKRRKFQYGFKIFYVGNDGGIQPRYKYNVLDAEKELRYEIGKTYKAIKSRMPLFLDEEKHYQTGFHFYPAFPTVYSYQNHIYKVFLCEFYDVRIQGEEVGRPVNIANYMKILREVEL